MKQYKIGTILCSYKAGYGWRVSEVRDTLDRKIQVVSLENGEKLLSVPSSILMKRGQFCNPADLALDFVTDGKRKSVSRKFPLVMSHKTFTEFMNRYRANYYQGLRLGLAFYHEFDLYEFDQAKLCQVWSKHNVDAHAAIRSFTKFI